VDKIKTPFLILHGSEDYRTGIAQSEMMYKALKHLGWPVEYCAVPEDRARADTVGPAGGAHGSHS
jgi:dipeptidyl aminopeptidase/acylaminoacyl peptidase